MKKSKLYTKSGDRGKTSLVGGQRVSKAAPRIESYGTIDELNSFVGLLRHECSEEKTLSTLSLIQHKLFSLGAYLATDPTLEGSQIVLQSGISPQTISYIEGEIDRLDEALPPLKAFILPAGGRSAALAHVCRTVARRAERTIYRLLEEQEKAVVEDAVLIFVNRLSDYFFVLARHQALIEGGREVEWDPTCK